jgi:phosphoribosylformimino-5-aminoimidazole carboxamide ribotide isomerase
MRIIPAIDIIDGKCVRLSQGDYEQKKIYNEVPLEIAKSFQDAGLQYLHLVDLDGAKAGKVTNWKVIETLTKNTTLQIDFGGGIKTKEEITNLFSAGIRQVNLGSIAVKNAALVTEWIEEFGGEKIILSADVKDDYVAIGGWMEASSLTAEQFIADYRSRGISYVTCTDISTDGMLSGPNVSLYKTLLSTFPGLKLIASGGVSGMKDVYDLVNAKVEGVIIGKAIYEGRISLKQLEEFQLSAGKIKS